MSQSQRGDHYATLQVSRMATTEEIRAAYRRLARQLHPDTVPDPFKSGVSEMMRQVNEAHHVLSDPQRRKAYDESFEKGTESREPTRQPESYPSPSPTESNRPPATKVKRRQYGWPESRWGHWSWMGWLWLTGGGGLASGLYSGLAFWTAVVDSAFAVTVWYVMLVVGRLAFLGCGRLWSIWTAPSSSSPKKTANVRPKLALLWNRVSTALFVAVGVAVGIYNALSGQDSRHVSGIDRSKQETVQASDVTSVVEPPLVATTPGPAPPVPDASKAKPSPIQASSPVAREQPVRIDAGNDEIGELRLKSKLFDDKTSYLPYDDDKGPKDCVVHSGGQTAMVSIDATSPAWVYWNEKVIGRTPLTHEFPLGCSEVRLRARDSESTRTLRVRVEAGTKKEYLVPL